MDKKLHLFIPITKIDIETRTIFGTATEEVPDRDDEILDYKSSKPLFEKWSEDIAKATDGKSLGNVREMHEPSAAGKITDLHFDDGAKRIQVAIKVVDEAAWEKCEEGVYSGLSMGGRYVRKWQDPDNKNLKRYTAQPYEVSLVDYPAVPTATFELVKAGGATETRKFQKTASKAEIRRARVEARIKGTFRTAALKVAAAKGGLGKGLWEVARFAEIAQDLVWLHASTAFERDMEGDASTVPDEMGEHLEGLLESLESMTAEEIEEAVASMRAVSGKSAASTKAARPSATTSAARITVMEMSKTAFKKLKKAHAEELDDIVGHANAVNKLFGEHVDDLPDGKHKEMGKALHTMHKSMCAKLEGFQSDVGGLPAEEPVGDEEHEVSGKLAKATGEIETLKKTVAEGAAALEKVTKERDETAKQLDEALELGAQLLEQKKGTLRTGDRATDGDEAAKAAAKKKADDEAAAAANATPEQKARAAFRKALADPSIDTGFGPPIKLNA